MYIYLSFVPVVIQVYFGNTLGLGKHAMDVLALLLPLSACCVPITFSCLVVGSSKFAIHLGKAKESKRVSTVRLPHDLHPSPRATQAVPLQRAP